jgi:hypothetical protein
LPLFPLARYRVRCVAPGRYQFLGKARFRRIEKIHGGIFAAAVLGIFLVLMFSASFHSLDTPTPAAQDQAQTETPSTSETDQPQVDVQAPKQVATAPTPARSPHKSQHRNLSAEKLLLDNEKSRLTSLREQLQTLDGELSQEQDRLRVEKTALSNLQQAAEAGTEIDIDAAESRRSAYNEAVEAFNRKLAEYKRIQKEFNDGVADYNTKAHAYNLSLEEQ